MTTEPTLITPTHAARHLQIHRRTLESSHLHRDPASRGFHKEDILQLAEERYQQRREALIVQRREATRSGTP